MTVEDLIRELSAYPGHAEVFLRVDSAGCERCGNWPGVLEDTACDVYLEPNGYIVVST